MRRGQLVLAAGLTMVVWAAILLVGKVVGSSFAIVFGGMGIVFIAVSRAKHHL